MHKAIFIKLRVLDIHIVVVSVVMVFIVVSLLFISTTALVLPAGPLAPHYHLNRYMFIYNINKFNREELFLNE